ncbi:MAG: cell division protein FtsK, partial [Ramlibacter sp.]|nr:cell division protein FtsK [Cryobacterium sp.]
MIASLAPLAVAGLIWMITGSAFVLLFALLGPVIALASMLDVRRTNRRARRRDAADETEALATLRAEISARHDLLRLVQWQRTPAANRLVAAPDDGAGCAGPPGLVALGSGPGESGPRLEGGAGQQEHRQLRDAAATLAGAPITADAGTGIGIAGPLPLVRALARGLLVQLACGLPPDQILLSVPPGNSWAWARALPRGVPGAAPRPGIHVCEAPTQPGEALAGARMLIALAGTPAELPWGCGTVVRVHGPGRAEILRSVVHARGLGFQPELVSVEQAIVVAARLRERAAAAVAAAAAGRPPSIPAVVRLSDPPATPPSRRHPARPPGRAAAPPGLSCAVGLTQLGEASLDLVGSGPHAVVGGTTGSGKSELLVTWVAAMAAAFAPSEVTFLLVDFKGGAAFAPLRALPHCVGLITDLDGRQAARALASLAAELRHRERVLRGAGARDLVELGEKSGAAALPRLVIVVDEFATMLTSFPELHALFVDIAARGRSLGVHLILCTQRPNGVVRDALLANCSLRLSLRVNNRADSVAVLGTDAAAALSAEHPGRCLIASESGDPMLCQIATTSEGEIRAIADRAVPRRAGDIEGPDARDKSAPRRPWLDLLPARVTRDDLRAAEAAAEAAEAAAESAGTAESRETLETTSSAAPPATPAG